jgi:hypothetical protein
LEGGQVSRFLFALEGIGAIFLGAFLVAYLMGLPTSAVYHSDPTLRMVLSIFGGSLIVLILFALIISVFRKRRD